jgi:hypothetical protein
VEKTIPLNPVFISERQGVALQDVVSVLNGDFDKEHSLGAESHENLIKLVENWQAAPALAAMKLPPGCPNLNEMQDHCRVILGPWGRGAFYAIDYSTFGKPWTAWDIAAKYFIRLITDPLRDRLGACPRCERFYVRKTAKQSIYCSHRCASQVTARRATEKARAQKHAEKLLLVQQELNRWEKLKRKGRTQKPWKQWVVDACPEAEIKISFLTRAMNNRELQIPADL